MPYPSPKRKVEAVPCLGAAVTCSRIQKETQGADSSKRNVSASRSKLRRAERPRPIVQHGMSSRLSSFP